MKKVSLILVLIFGFPLVFFGQENKGNGIKLIKDFYRELYTNDVTPEEIVSKYVGYSDEDQYKKAVYMVMDFRNLAIDESGHFFLFKKAIIENNFSIYSYLHFE